MHKNITAKVELITVEVATQLLENNGHNRKQTQNNIKVIEKALINNEWQVSGQTIIIALNGDLMDGQHRLQAVVNTGIPMYHLVCRGVEPSVFSVIDTGKARNGADTLSISGVAEHTKIANIVRQFEGYKQQALHNLPKLSNTEILTIYEANEDMYLLALEDGQLYRTANTLTDVQWAVLSLVMKTVIKGDEYLSKFLNGDFERVNEAITLARKQGGGRIATARMWVAIFAGYKYFVRGISVPDRQLKTKAEVNGKDRALSIPYPHKD